MTQRLEDLHFADDICMLSHRLPDANNQMERYQLTIKWMSNIKDVRC